MATVPFPGSWLPDTQFSGNSEFVLDSKGHLWMVANSTMSGSIVYVSTDNGASFTEAIAMPGAGASGIGFDPAVAIDVHDVLHIVGQVIANGTVALEKYSVDTVAGTLSGPFLLSTGGVVGSDFDLVPLSNGNCYVVSAVLNGMNESVRGMEVTPTGAVLRVDPLVSEAWAAGSRYGSVSLATTDGHTVEIYLCSIPKAFTFTDSPITVSVIVRVGNVPGVSTVLWSGPCRYVADRLTVIASGSSRYLAQAYFTQVGNSLIGSVLVGVNGGLEWSFQTFSGTPTRSFVEPVLSVSPTGVVLASIGGQPNVIGGGASIALDDLDVTSWTMSARSDFPYPVLANWLRGTKAVLPSGVPWAFVAQRAADGVARFFTGFSIPPVAHLQPTSATGIRGVAQAFDASATFDQNLHPLRFSWSLADPTGVAVLASSGSSSTVTLPTAAGPLSQILTVTVSVVDVDAEGNALHPPATASASLLFPLIPPPTIAPFAPLAARRNATVTVVPTVTCAPSSTPLYFWAQVGGTPVTLLSQADALTLTLNTSGAAVGGETLTFRLFVEDGLNTPVEGDFDVVVAARAPTGETRVLARALWNGNLSQRNSEVGWAAPVSSATVTGFTSLKRSPVFRSTSTGPKFGVGGASVLVGPASVTVDRMGESWRVLTPVPSETILDALHGPPDQTLVLTSGGKLLAFSPTSPALDTDHAQGTIDLASISLFPWTQLQAGTFFAGVRVLILSGPSGVLLLEVDTAFQVRGTIALTGSTGELYGASHVVFVRASEVEDLHSGRLLIGTVDAYGNSFETEFSLGSRSVLNVFDATDRKNQAVTTGEMLFANADIYPGVPAAPVLAPPVVDGGNVSLSWTASRTDLVTGYLVFVNGGIALTIAAGIVTSARISLAPGATYTVAVASQSMDGSSAQSNSFTLPV